MEHDKAWDDMGVYNNTKTTYGDYMDSPNESSATEDHNLHQNSPKNFVTQSE